jgi:hypothetical protein
MLIKEDFNITRQKMKLVSVQDVWKAKQTTLPFIKKKRLYSHLVYQIFIQLMYI